MGGLPSKSIISGLANGCLIMGVGGDLKGTPFSIVGGVGLVGELVIIIGFFGGDVAEFVVGPLSA